MSGPWLPTLPFLAMLVAVGIAAATQRVTGVGFALISAPLLVLGAGPSTGVLLANVLSLGIQTLVLAQTWRRVELRRVLLLVVPALICVPLGNLVARGLPPGPLLVVVGALVLAGLAALQFLPPMPALGGTAGAIVAGGVSGFMNVTAGVGGPAVILYAAASGWAQAGFVASIQLYFALINVASIGVKGLPSVAPVQLALLAVALVAGLYGGTRLTRHVTPSRARQAALLLAALGALATVVKGVTIL